MVPSPIAKLTLPNHEHFTPKRLDFKASLDIRPSWESRSSIPLFRGSLQVPKTKENYISKDHPLDNNFRLKLIDSLGKEFNKIRAKAMNFSYFNPDLLDAKITGFKSGRRSYWYWDQHELGLSANPLYRIDHKEYYTKHKFVLVIEGIGAAFRLTLHFAAQQLVILKDTNVQEWFTRFLVAGVHYIPVKSDLSDLREVLEWVRDHDAECQQIARNGRLFYEAYLSLDKSSEYAQAMLTRLGELEHEAEFDIVKFVNDMHCHGIHKDCPASIRRIHYPYIFTAGMDPDSGKFRRRPYLDYLKENGLELFEL